MQDRIREILTESILLKQAILSDETMVTNIGKVSDVCTIALKAKKKILLCGNGGSAADAQHIAAELSGRFLRDREPFNAEALTVNSSYITSVANDYGFDEVFARLIKAKANQGDVFIGLSTSGNSMNILKALEEARKIGMITVGMTGRSGGKMLSLCDLLLNVPSAETPRIQEAHITIGHIFCELIETNMLSSISKV